MPRTPIDTLNNRLDTLNSENHGLPDLKNQRVQTLARLNELDKTILEREAEKEAIIKAIDTLAGVSGV